MTDSGRDFQLVAAGVGTACVFYVAPWAWLYLPALLVVGFLAWSRIDLALLLVPVFAPAFMVPKHLGSKEFAPSEIFLAVTVVVALVQIARRTDAANWERLRTSPFWVPLALLVFAGALSTAFASDRHLALRAYEQRVLEPALFFALVLLFFKRRSSPWYLGAALLGVAAGLSALGLAQFVTHRDLSQVPGSRVQRVKALYGSPDNLGLLLDRAIPLCFALLTVRWNTRRERLFLLAVGTVLVLALALTYSRGAWLACAVAGLMVVVARVPWGRWIAVGCIAVAGLALAFEGPVLARAFGSGHSGTAQKRVDIWTSSVHMIQDHPLLGIGPDNFQHYYAPSYQRYPQCANGLNYLRASAANEPCLSHPHDEFLDFWLSTGILGLAAFIWIEAVFWRLSWRQWRAEDSPQRRAVVLACAAAMFASLVHGLVDNAYFLVDLATIFWLLCAMISLNDATSRTPQAP